MVPHNAKDSFVVVASGRRVELNNDSSLTLWLDDTFRFREGENVGSIVVELECGRLVGVIDNIQ